MPPLIVSRHVRRTAQRNCHARFFWYDEASHIRARSAPRLDGFTLIELLIVVTVMSVIMGALFVSMIIGRSSYVSSDAYVQVQQEARRALDTMGRELRAARDPITVGAGQVTFQVALGYDLVGCVKDDVCWGAQDATGANQPNWNIRYSVNNSRQLVRDLLNGAAVQSTRVLANEVNAATFIYTPATKVVTMTLDVVRNSNQLPGGQMAASPAPLAGRVTLRN